MHPDALNWVERCVAELGPFTQVVEIGSRNINGGVRHLFNGCDYVGVDLLDGPGVDKVGDIIDLADSLTADCVVSTEALEHHPDPRSVIAAAARILPDRGVLIATMAGPGRQSHSGLIEGPVQAGEHYRNIEPGELRSWLDGWAVVEVDQHGADLRCWAIK